MIKRYIPIFFTLFMTVFACAQSIDEKLHAAGIKSVETFREFLSIPNDALNPNDIQKNVDWCTTNLEKRNWKTNVLPTPTRPLLYAEYEDKRDVPTVLFYFHIDGQSVDPQYWFQDDPYKAVLKESVEGEGWKDMDWSELTIENYNPDWYVFARSASDSKNNFMAFLTAWDVMKEEKIELPYRLKLIFDFEEEKSSPSLASTVAKHKELLKADMLVIYDGPRHISNEPTLSFGARGISILTLTVYGPVFPQHSGHYGNYAPNPALKLSKLLGSMKDDYGRVTIPGFYDGIEFDEKTRSILDAVPDDENVIKARLGFASADKVGNTYQQALQYPSLNIRGMSSGWVGAEARTIVPAQATAEIDIRLVKEVNPDRLIRLVKQHIIDQGYYLTEDKPTQKERLTYPNICRFSSKVAYKAFRTEFDTPIGKWLTRAMENAFKKIPVRTRTMGGSIPISPFIDALDAPAVVVPMANRDNNQHSPNENIRLGNYVESVKAMFYILTTSI